MSLVCEMAFEVEGVEVPYVFEYTYMYYYPHDYASQLVTSWVLLQSGNAPLTYYVVKGGSLKTDYSTVNSIRATKLIR